MKKFLLILICFIMCFLMTSCYSTQTVLLSGQELTERYVGKTGKEIIRMMGPPTRETTDGGDGTILIYEAITGSTTRVTYTEYNTYYNTTQKPDEYSWFYLDSKGVCTYVKTNCLTKQVSTFNGFATGLYIVLLSGLVAFLIAAPFIAGVI